MTDTATAKNAPPKDTLLVRLLKSGPEGGAGVMLGLLVVPPLSILFISLQEGWSGWCTVSLVLAGAALVPALSTLLRFSWANSAGQYLCWAELVQVGLRIISTGFRPIHILPAGFAVIALLTLTSAQPAPPATKDRSADSLGVWLKENIEAIVVAFIMALVIRCFCIEVFKIPSSSMEPTLLGDCPPEHQSCPFKYEHRFSDSGDRIMVTKYFYAFAPIERYDVVVFKFPLNQSKNFIKRVVGLPNERLKILHGNIFVKRADEKDVVHLKTGGRLEGWASERGDTVEVETATGKVTLGRNEVARIERKDFHIARRSLRTQDSIWIPVDDGEADYLSSRRTFGDHWGREDGEADFQVQDRELASLEQPKGRSISFKHMGKIDDGARIDRTPVGELQLAFEFELTSPHGAVFAEIVNEYGRFEAWLTTDGASELRYHEPGSENTSVPTQRVPFSGFTLTPDRRTRLALSVYDGVAIVRINGSVVGKWEFIDALPEDPKERRVKFKLNDSPQRAVRFGTRDATFKAWNLSLGRDVYYKPKDHVVEDRDFGIGPNQYVMMGDNVDSSHDARSWTRHVIHLQDGRSVEFEGQERNNDRTLPREEVLSRYGLTSPPSTIISADKDGNPWALYSESEVPPAGLQPKPFVGIIKDEDSGVWFNHVDRKFIVGKALWIWWPKGRWFRLIR